jgi:hypothetical protein
MRIEATFVKHFTRRRLAMLRSTQYVRGKASRQNTRAALCSSPGQPFVFGIWDKLHVMSSLVANSVTQLNTSIAVDETILSDDPRIIVMRFGSKLDAMCKFQDEVIMRVAPRLQASCVVHARGFR